MAVTGYINLRLLYMVSKPLTILRKILVYACFIAFYALLIIYRKLFLITNINVWTFVFIILLILSSNYLIDAFINIYDKIILYIDNKRSRVSREKN